MPQYEGTPVLTIGKADECREVARQWFSEMWFSEMGCEAPALHKPGHEGPMWVLSLEGGPEDWPLVISGSIGNHPATWPPGVFVEPVNSWCLGLYPAPDADEARTSAQLADDYERAVATGNAWAQNKIAGQMAKRLRGL